MKRRRYIARKIMNRFGYIKICNIPELKPKDYRIIVTQNKKDIAPVIMNANDSMNITYDMTFMSIAKHNQQKIAVYIGGEKIGEMDIIDGGDIIPLSNIEVTKTIEIKVEEVE